MKALALFAHWAAIVLLVGGPLTALVAPNPGAGQLVMAFLIGFAALAIAEIHAGLFDEIAAEFFYEWKLMAREEDE